MLESTAYLVSVSVTLRFTTHHLCDTRSSVQPSQTRPRNPNPLFLCASAGGEVVKIAQLASLAGPPSRVAQPETPVTLQFQGNKFTLSHSQLRQLTAGQPLQLQGMRQPPAITTSSLASAPCRWGRPGSCACELSASPGPASVRERVCHRLPGPDVCSVDDNHFLKSTFG